MRVLLNDENRAQELSKFSETLNKGPLCFNFTKADGSQKTVIATLEPLTIEKFEGPKKEASTPARVDTTHLTYYDLTKLGWGKVNPNRLNWVEYPG